MCFLKVRSLELPGYVVWLRVFHEVMVYLLFSAAVMKIRGQDGGLTPNMASFIWLLAKGSIPHWLLSAGHCSLAHGPFHRAAWYGIWLRPKQVILKRATKMEATVAFYCLVSEFTHCYFLIIPLVIQTNPDTHRLARTWTQLSEDQWGLLGD